MLRRFCTLILALVIACPGLAWSAGPDRDSGAMSAVALVRAGHWKRARAILESQIKTRPQDPQALSLLAQVKMSFKDFDGALPLAQHAVVLDGKNSDYHLTLGKVYGELAARASMFSAGMLAIKFRKEVEMALQLYPGNLDALDAMMLFKFQAPRLMGGDKDEANALAEKITLLNPSEGWLAHAELAELQNSPAQMAAFYSKAVRADPRNYAALTALARFYSQSPGANYDEATKQAESALRLDTGRVEAHWVLARVFARQQRWADLDETLADSERTVPDDLRPFYEAAQEMLDIGQDLLRAEKYARKYLSQEPEGDEPDLAEAHRLLGLLLAGEGRRDQARAEIQTALRIRPDFKAAKDDLRRLGG